MTKSFLWAVITVLAIGLGFFVWLDYRQLKDFDSCHPTHRTVRA